MNVLNHVPEDELRFAIRRVSIMEAASEFNVTFFPIGYPFIACANGAKILIDKLQYQNKAYSYLCGLTNAPFRMSLPKTERILIVQLQPWIISQLFPFAALNFLNQEIPLNTIDKDFSTQLEDNLNDFPFGPGLIKNICQLVFKRLHPIDLDHRLLAAWKMMIMQNGNVRIKEISENINLSKRRLEQIFKEHVGFAPKNYERIVRFQHTIFENIICGQKKLEPTIQYFDQAHFSKEINSFTGMTPGNFFKIFEDPVQKSTLLQSNLYSNIKLRT